MSTLNAFCVTFIKPFAFAFISSWVARNHLFAIALAAQFDVNRHTVRQALAALARADVPDEVAAAYTGTRLQFGRDYIIPTPFDPRLMEVVSSAVAKAAMDSGVAKAPIEDFDAYALSLKARLNPTTSVLTNTYEIDQDKFNEGLLVFRRDNFVLARDLFERADKEKRDAKTQFYIAYSYYRQGWGRFSNDDELFKKGLEQIKRVKMLDDDFKSDDVDLMLRNPVELQHEFEEGLRITADDFNPFKLTRERK